MIKTSFLDPSNPDENVVIMVVGSLEYATNVMRSAEYYGKIEKSIHKRVYEWFYVSPNEGAEFEDRNWARKKSISKNDLDLFEHLNIITMKRGKIDKEIYSEFNNDVKNSYHKKHLISDKEASRNDFEVNIYAKAMVDALSVLWNLYDSAVEKGESTEGELLANDIK